MFIQNQIPDLDNHKSTIATAFANAGEARLIVAYVRENGVDMILDSIQGKQIKLLCSLDMGITQLSGIRKLLENGVDVRIYKSNEGTFHPKVWLFKNNKTWEVLIGSANLTAAALVDNVEASVFLNDTSITSNAVMFFNYLWNAGNSENVTLDDIEKLEEQLSKRQAIRNQKHSTSLPTQQDEEKIQKLFPFIKDWIDISKSAQKGISSIWRGWYIIPDQGYIDDALASNLAEYIRIIGSSVTLDTSMQDKHYRKLLRVFRTRSQFQRTKLKLSLHALFIRQAKNYLVKFGWADHPLVKKSGEYQQDKRILKLTTLGQRVAQCRNISEVRELYSEYFEEYLFNGLAIVKFTRRLLEKLGYLDLPEFDYFVVHAYNEDDLTTIIDLIETYRSCENKNPLHSRVLKYFNEAKEHTAKNVRGNYIKKVKHTMSAIAWCNGLSMSEDFVITLIKDENK